MKDELSHNSKSSFLGRSKNGSQFYLALLLTSTFGISKTQITLSIINTFLLKFKNFK